MREDQGKELFIYTGVSTGAFRYGAGSRGESRRVHMACVLRSIVEVYSTLIVDPPALSHNVFLVEICSPLVSQSIPPGVENSSLSI